MSSHESKLRWRLAIVLLIVSTTQIHTSASDGLSPEQLQFFETRIRPVLVSECQSCHSQQAAGAGKLRGGLLLDSREGIQLGGESGPVILPGKPEESLLIEALRHQSLEMPPNGKLPDEVINNFVKWVEMGAPDPRDGNAVAAASAGIDIAAGRQFWSFRTLARNVPPKLSSLGSDWARNEIDRFIWAKLQEKELKPNERAASYVLVRRAWFDLLGLPPSVEQMEHWSKRLEGDAGHFNSQAWAELIEYLLDQPQYGERWARHWLDIARFAESHGYEQDYDRPNAYHYRDFLIKAFNADLPYDQFVRWQLAGDELSPEHPSAWMATGFLGGGAFPTQLTENEFESARYDELDDMVATTGVAFLGLSVACARCHDHKFDPIPMADYYRLAATFTTAIRSEKEFDLDPAGNRQRAEAFATELAKRQAKVHAIEREDLPRALLARLRDFAHPMPPTAWVKLEGQVESSAGTKFSLQADGSVLATGKAPAREVITIKVKELPRSVKAIRLEALTDGSLPLTGPGRAANGNFALGNFQLIVKKIGPEQSNAPAEVAVQIADVAATHQQNAHDLSIAASIDDNPVSGWAVDGQIGQDHAAVFRLAKPLELSPGAELIIRLAFNHPNKQHTIGRFRISASTVDSAPVSIGDFGPSNEVRMAAERLAKALPPPDPMDGAVSSQQLVAWVGSHASDWQTALHWFRGEFEPLKQAESELAELEKAGPSTKLTRVLVTSEGLPHLPHHADGRGFPHFYPVTYVLRRGDVTQKVEEAEAGFLQVLVPDQFDPQHWAIERPAGEALVSYRRSALAQWMTDPQHGAGQLAARVMVNRLWQHHFGRGLVATPNDFGVSGERPTHPELLDWLAGELIRNQWHLKPIHKAMMLSATYTQSSAVSTTQAIQDQRLLLDPHNLLHWRRSPQRLEAEAIRDNMLSAAGLLDSTMFGAGTLDQNMSRRSIYFFIKRSQLIPMMMLFDWPEHLVSIGQRSSTTIAPQALMFMNSPQGRAYAEGFASRLPPDEPSAAVATAYRIAFGREPSSEELRLGCEFIDQQIAARSDLAETQRRLQGLSDFCQVVLSSNEFVFIE